MADRASIAGGSRMGHGLVTVQSRIGARRQSATAAPVAPRGAEGRCAAPGAPRIAAARPAAARRSARFWWDERFASRPTRARTLSRAAHGSQLPAPTVADPSGMPRAPHRLGRRQRSAQPAVGPPHDTSRAGWVEAPLGLTEGATSRRATRVHDRQLRTPDPPFCLRRMADADWWIRGSAYAEWYAKPFVKPFVTGPREMLYPTLLARPP